MRAAVQALRLMGPARIIVAAPVGAADTCEMLRNDADAVVCLKAPDNFSAVGRWYLDFTQTTDEEVSELLNQAAWERGSVERERSDAPPLHAPMPSDQLGMNATRSKER